MITIDSLEKQLEIFKRFLWAGCGASMALLFTSIVERRNTPDFPIWYLILLGLLVLVALSAGLVLLLTHRWRLLPLGDRLNVSMGFLGVAWTKVAPAICGRSFSMIPLPRPN
jgi:hypothetical protein